jgi:predicted protein tyrosine phosphatase
MNIQVLSRSQAKEFISDVPWACISIATEQSDFPKINKVQQIGILQIIFADVDTQEHLEYLDKEVGIKSQLFSKSHAEKILNFINEVKDKIEILMVHCTAGASRSPAVAAAIQKILGQDDSHWFKTKCPNALVYRTILQTANERGEYDPFNNNDLPPIEGKCNY